ncbi:helicase-exonuclease AddAB subunit AddB [Exiguobacterium oxidotolerans]|uniref:ATP-dependent helicase/deoxyribonuclease subunit B n=1 Tax=Exiguobacterium oxidotolerans TaxID=223958 RepID=A0A653I2S5_9BACL|nr:helicase-exonuclease AddAB subunit AddB [Exiguobacterium oxidotolerans]VWX33211.1 ATP-dependent helicase/deoxyribonuclease subunit B [Exiguobacterium oxidotolerans]
MTMNHMHLGRAGTGKTTKLIETVINELEERPLGESIYFIVPDQMSFEMERRIATDARLSGLVRMEVMSLRRFAFHIMRDHGNQAIPFLDETGTQLLLRQVVEEVENELKIFKRTKNMPGFYKGLDELIATFKRSLVAPDMLRQISELSPERSPKLNDLALIYERFSERILDKALHADDYYTTLLDLLPTAGLGNTQFFIDGFYEFSLQEQQVLLKLMELAKEVHISFTIDVSDPYAKQTEFGVSQRCYMQLLEQMQDRQLEHEEIHYERTIKFKSEGLQTLEQALMSPAYPPVDHQVDGVTVTAAVNRQVETEAAVRQAIQLVRQHGYRFNEIAFIVRHLEPYADHLERAFQLYDIPYFLDKRATMIHHPIVELIQSALELVVAGYREEAVFRLLKTELMPLPADDQRLALDRLETFVLERGIKGTMWQKPWQLKRRLTDEVSLTAEELEEEDELNRMRQFVVDAITPLQGRLKKSKTMSEHTRSLYQFLEEHQLTDRLFSWKQEALERNELSHAREHDQVYEAVLHLLEQLEAAAPETELSTDLFVQMVETGLESLRFSLVPPSLDQVIATDYVRGRLQRVKVAFLLGANDGMIPFVEDQSKLLSEGDHDFLHNHGVPVGKASLDVFDDELYYLYHGVTAPSEALYISYALVDEDGKALQPASIVKQIKYQLLQDRPVKTHFAEAGEHAPNDQFDFVTDPDRAAAATAIELRRLQRRYPIQSSWFDVYNALLENGQGRERMALLADALFYQNRADELPDDLARSLYGDSIKASVSRFETYNACSYKHFARYGLRLKERKLYKFEAPDIGNLFHGALNDLSVNIKESGRKWRDLDDASCTELAKNAVEKVTPDIQNAILMSSNRFGYIQKKLTDVVEQTAKMLVKQAERSDFEPDLFEISFGNAMFPPLRFTLPDGTEIEFTGRIDRVDQATIGDQLYVRIVDYKSSARALDFAEIYYGLAIQMLLYLKTVVEQSEVLFNQQAKPAGALYFHVKNPMLRSDLSAAEEERNRLLLESYQMQGVIVENDDVLRAMDQVAFDERKKSPLVKVTFTKTGLHKSHTKGVVKEAELNALMDHAWDELKTSSAEMYAGDIAIDPFDYQERTPCTFCEYRSVCQFDESLGNSYRQLDPLSEKEVLDRLKEEEE